MSDMSFLTKNQRCNEQRSSCHGGMHRWNGPCGEASQELAPPPRGARLYPAKCYVLPIKYIFGAKSATLFRCERSCSLYWFWLVLIWVDLRLMKDANTANFEHSDHSTLQPHLNTQYGHRISLSAGCKCFARIIRWSEATRYYSQDYCLCSMSKAKG